MVALHKRASWAQMRTNEGAARGQGWRSSAAGSSAGAPALPTRRLKHKLPLAEGLHTAQTPASLYIRCTCSNIKLTKKKNTPNTTQN